MHNITRDKYFDDLDVYSQKISKIIGHELDNINITEHKNFFNKKRKNKSYQRPFFFKYILQILIKKNHLDEDLANLIGSYIEILNISTYLSNHSFDEKNSINSKLKSNNQVIASMLLRDYLDKEIISLAKNNLISIDEALNFIKVMADINYNIYRGQHMDMNELTIDNYTNFQNEKEYLQRYEERCYLITGIFQEKIVEVATVFSDNVEHQDTLLKFAKYLGIGIQIVNDIGDFILESNGAIDTHKDHQDYFADLRNDKLTLPIYYALGNLKLKNDILKIAKEDTYGFTLYQNIAETMYKEKIFNKSKKIALKYYKLADNELKKLPNSKEKSYLKHMLLLLKVNKYYTTLRIKYASN